MDLALKFAALLVLLLNVSLTLSIVQGKDDYEHCENVVQKWASSSLHLESQEDKHTLKDLLFFLHIPRTGGRSYFFCFLKKLYDSSLECPRSYDKLRLDPSKPNCRLLVTHDDYSMMSKLHEDKTSVVTILRNPIDRVFSTYEFSIEVAARFLVYPNLTFAMGTPQRLRSKRGGISTLDIWPWKYLVPWMREDLFARREIRSLEDSTYTSNNDPYNMGNVVMPLHEYINDPIARDIIHNGATFQVAGLTNNSFVSHSHEVRRCVLEHHALGGHVLQVAKKRLDNMLYVGLTEDHKESATMFADVVGSQVISQSIPTSHNTEHVVDERSDGSSPSLVSESETRNHLNGSADQKRVKIRSTNIQITSKNMTVGKLIKGYETCIRGLRSNQATRRVLSFKRIFPANFTKETRLRVPDVVVQQIQSLNSLDIELYAYAKDIFSKKHKHIMQKLDTTNSKRQEGQNRISEDTDVIPLKIRMLERQESITRDVYGFPLRNILCAIATYRNSSLPPSLSPSLTPSMLRRPETANDRRARS